MCPLARIVKLAAAMVISLFVASNPAQAEEIVDNLGPVGPYGGIMAHTGSMHVVAFFEPANGRCAVNAVIWDDLAGDPSVSAKRVRVNLDPKELFHIETVAHGRLSLQCGENAATLMVVDTESLSASGITAQPERQPATPPP